MPDYAASETSSRSPGEARFPIQSLLSARLMLAPQISRGRIYFLSDMSGVISLYAIDKDGSIPEPLLPTGLALQNPHLMNGHNYYVLPKLGKILVMIDENGNENYQPCFIPLEGGIPQPVFGGTYANQQVNLMDCDAEKNIAYFWRDDRKNPGYETLQVELDTLRVTSLGRSDYGNAPNGANKDHSKVILGDGYLAGDVVLFLWRKGSEGRSLLYGTPLEKRKEGETVKLSNFGFCNFTPDDAGVLVKSCLLKDEGSLCYIPLDSPQEIREVSVSGLKHSGSGELVDVRHVHDDIYLLEYNIDGCSWVYEGRLSISATPSFHVERVLCGQPPFDGGVQLGLKYEVQNGHQALKIEYVLSFTKASSPSQLYLIPSDFPKHPPKRLSNERILGIPKQILSEGEDASYTSFDGRRVSARLYMPSETLRYKGPRPLVLYVHGGPQGQERPDFTWFSMPLIQHLTLNGFAVFVPNVRGSTGYGLSYMQQVTKDWGGKDVLDHLEGLKMLEKDPRIDSSKRAVVGRSYGGYMTLTLASRHPDLWKAACDMFGPYDLISFMERLPASWRTMFYLEMGNPEKDGPFLRERSPKTYIQNVKCPMLIIQGKNDPRVVERESHDVVEGMRARGSEVDYLVFEDEGHDVIKFKNKVLCYNRIVDFFSKHLEAAAKPAKSAT